MSDKECREHEKGCCGIKAVIKIAAGLAANPNFSTPSQPRYEEIATVAFNIFESIETKFRQKNK